MDFTAGRGEKKECFCTIYSEMLSKCQVDIFVISTTDKKKLTRVFKANRYLSCPLKDFLSPERFDGGREGSGGMFHVYLWCLYIRKVAGFCFLHDEKAMK